MQPRTVAAVIAFAATVPFANWMIANVGTECMPNGPCILPVGFGLYAPSGVLVVGASLVLRDLVHEIGGVFVAIAAILLGGLAARLFADPALVGASVAAFLLSELADLIVYAPLRARRLWLAVFLSGVVGAVVDSAVFLLLAFGSLDFIAGQIVGKAWVSILAIPLLQLARRSRLSVKG